MSLQVSTHPLPSAGSTCVGEPTPQGSGEEWCSEDVFEFLAMEPSDAGQWAFDLPLNEVDGSATRCDNTPRNAPTPMGSPPHTKASSKADALPMASCQPTTPIAAMVDGLGSELDTAKTGRGHPFVVSAHRPFSARHTSSCTFFDTVQAAGLGTFPAFQEPSQRSEFFSGPEWDRMAEPADLMTPYVFDDVHAMGTGTRRSSTAAAPMPAPALPFFSIRTKARQSGVHPRRAAAPSDHTVAKPPVVPRKSYPCPPDADDDVLMEGSGGFYDVDGLGPSSAPGPVDTSAPKPKRTPKPTVRGRKRSSDMVDDDEAEDEAQDSYSVASGESRASGSRTRVKAKVKAQRARAASDSKRDRSLAPGRTPFVSGQHQRPECFFIDVHSSVLPAAALKWLVDKVEAQEHSQKTCRYYLSRSPVCSACRDVFKAGRKLYESDGSVKCLYRAVRLQACMDVGMRFDAVGGGAANLPGEHKRRKKLKRQQRGAGRRECSVGTRMRALLKVLAETREASGEQ